ncbi:MAG TPA: hypothetical protein VD905_12565 [Flavobacteriales bacterium]|nr:hypothetical protein [Flavobacteriales bacterium]
MKRKILLLPAVCLSAGLSFYSCQSSEDKIQDATEDVIEAQEKLDDARADAEERNYEEWNRFKMDYEDRMAEYDREIEEHRDQIRNLRDERKQERFNEIERKRDELNERMERYESEEDYSRWESFKTEFNRDMNQLGRAIKDLFKDNEK